MKATWSHSEIQKFALCYKNEKKGHGKFPWNKKYTILTNHAGKTKKWHMSHSHT